MCDTDLSPVADLLSCDWTSDLTTDHVPVGGDQSGVDYYFARDSSGNRCITQHPIILVQGFGQYAESWAACHRTRTSNNFTNDASMSLGAEDAQCMPVEFFGVHFPQFTSGGNDWCPDIVELITSKGGDVITIDFDKAQRDINDIRSTFGWDRTWLRPGGTVDAPPASGDHRRFAPYFNAAKLHKGNVAQALREEFGRRGEILDNAMVLALAIDFLYRGDGFEQTRGRKPIVVGHSMGGVVANWAMVSRSWGMNDGTFLGRDAWPQVHAVVTLGSPTLGVAWSNSARRSGLQATPST